MALLLIFSSLGCGEDAPGSGPPSGQDNNPAPNNDPCAQPGPEVCDGEDNDCDGVADEDFNLVGDVEHCGGCEVVCAFERGRASCLGGQCVLAGCLPGFFDADNDPLNGCESTECTPQGEEVCNNADDDCDGDFDEGFGVGETPERCGGCEVACDLPRAEASCQDGVCGIAVCQEGFEDEDGEVANGCEAVVCTPDPGAEVCDGEDNDCDGQVDEGFDLLTDLRHCGGCDRACELDGATPACEAGRCLIEGCLGDHLDLDEAPENGCEYLCEAADRSDREIPCDGQDNDCNGVIDDDPRLGSACALGPGLDGLLVCFDGGLICAAPPAPSTEICGDLDGLLPLEGSPYVIVCDEVTVPSGSRLVVAEGVEVRSGLRGGLTPRVRVQGRMRSLGARWSGISLIVQGNVVLGDDVLSAAGSSLEPLIAVADEGARLDALGVSLVGQGQAGVGLVLGDAAEAGLTWRGGRVASLGVGVAVEMEGDVVLEDVEFVDNTTAISIDEAAAVAVEGGALRNTAGIQARGIVVDAAQVRARLTLGDLALEQREGDAAITLDPDSISQVEGTARHVGEGRSTVHLSGDLESAATLAPLGELDGFSILGTMVVGEGVELGASSEVALRGGRDSLLRVEGLVSLREIAIDDLAIRVEPGGALDVDGARVSAGPLAPPRGCLIEVVGVLSAQGARIAATAPLALDGICAQGVTPSLEGAIIAGFARGLVISSGSSEVIGGVRFEDNGVGLFFEGERAPEIRGNTFASLTDRQTVAIQMQIGANPGGVIAENTFDIDQGDSAYHLDPDNLANTAGTIFGPNVWSRHQPDGYLLSGDLEGAASIKAVTERPPEDDLFIAVQVLGPLAVRAGGRLDIAPRGQIVTMDGIEVGLAPTSLEIEGHLRLDGPGVLVNNLPISFRPGSTGVVTRADLSGARRDLPLVLIEDAEPTIGGVGSASAVRLTGSNQRDMVGVEIRSTSAMCLGLESLCPFIASNDFRNLGVGIALISPASFSGVNDFDDANPNGDTVPINVERR